MIVKYATGVEAGPVLIKRVECTRETPAFVYLPTSARGNKNCERREAKASEWAQYHDSWAAAHAYLVTKAEDKVKSLRLQLQAANGHLGNIKGMKNPEAPK